MAEGLLPLPLPGTSQSMPSLWPERGSVPKLPLTPLPFSFHPTVSFLSSGRGTLPGEKDSIPPPNLEKDSFFLPGGHWMPRNQLPRFAQVAFSVGDAPHSCSPLSPTPLCKKENFPLSLSASSTVDFQTQCSWPWSQAGTWAAGDPSCVCSLCSSAERVRSLF